MPAPRSRTRSGSRRAEALGDALVSVAGARRGVGRLAQRQPVGAEPSPSAATPLEHGVHPARGIVPGRQRVAHRRAPPREPCAHAPRSSSSTCESASASAVTSPGGTTMPGLVADELGNRAGARADDRQPARQRLGHGHAVAFVQRRQHEHIGRRRSTPASVAASTSPANATRLSRPSVAQPARAAAPPSPRSRSRLPTQVRRQLRCGIDGQRAEQHVVTLARDERRDAQQLQRRRRREPRASGAAVGARLDDRDRDPRPTP